MSEPITKERMAELRELTRGDDSCTHCGFITECLDEIERLKQDEAMVDWIEEHATYMGGGNGGTYSFFCIKDTECLRDALAVEVQSSEYVKGIKSAMKGKQP